MNIFIIISIVLLFILIISFIMNNNLKKEIKNLNEKLNNQEVISSEKENNTELLLQLEYTQKEADLQKQFELEKQRKQFELQQEIDEWLKSAQEAANYYADLTISENLDTQEFLQSQINNLTSEMQELKLKRDAINQEILRQREIQENTKFYQIQISQSDKNDILIFNELRNRISKIDCLNKMIYDNYIRKPTLEMIKRVTNNEPISGIYKVTNQITNEIYIGKSSNVVNRWKDHVMSAFGLDGCADSQFQRSLKQYGVDNFTWEILEKVPKENLTEREKYYINFYDTTNFGLNMRQG